MMSVTQLQPGDEEMFRRYQAVSAWFEEIVDLNKADEPSDVERIRAFLDDPTVLFWLAVDGEQPVGMLHCYVQRRYAEGNWAELLLFEIGTHASHRRRGVGRALLDAMESWMREQAVNVVWVPAAGPAIEFYEACGYAVDDDADRVMSKNLR